MGSESGLCEPQRQGLYCPHDLSISWYHNYHNPRFRVHRNAESLKISSRSIAIGFHPQSSIMNQAPALRLKCYGTAEGGCSQKGGNS